MIHNLSEIITNFLISKKVINENESEIYIYGYETFFSGVIDLIITLILGILFRRLIPAIVFFAMFVSVRMYTGGYHADSYLKCKMIFIGIIISVLGMTYIKFPLYIVFLITALFLITVYRLCPIENPNKPLSKQQKRKYRKIGLLYSILWSIAASLLSHCLCSLEWCERRKKTMKKNAILKAVAAIGRKSALKAYNASSAYGSYQPKEPEALKKLKK